MTVPDLRSLTRNLNDGVLAEHTGDEGRIALWVRGHFQDNAQQWRRIASVPRAEIVVRENLRAISATCMPMRQVMCGLFGKLRRRFSGSSPETWALPTGEPVESAGPRRKDLMLRPHRTTRIITRS